ncbi:MAG TPA: aldose 1-epimerase [Blastocatellia bacterium]|nr:aldose 1-epimerase [Blastocatellia bacterium]
MAEHYAVNRRTRDGVEVYVLEQDGRARAEIAPALGNNCFALRAASDILEPVAFDEFVSRPTSYGIPVLFPFPNRLRDGAFTFQGTTYHVNPPRHGFVRDKAWKVVEAAATESDGAFLRCRFDAREHADTILGQFPFPFVLEMTYRLRDGKLGIHLTATNLGERTMPTGFGLHPYFRRPTHGAIQVPARDRWELADSLPTGNVLKVDEAYDLRQPRDLSGLVLDDIYSGLTTTESGMTECRLIDEAQRTETVIEFSARQFPFVVVYTPPAPRPAICIEPNTCPTDAFNLEQRGIASNVIALAAGAQASFDVWIYQRPLD